MNGETNAVATTNAPTASRFTNIKMPKPNGIAVIAIVCHDETNPK